MRKCSKQEVTRGLRWVLPCLLLLVAGSVFAADFAVVENDTDSVSRYTNDGATVVWTTASGYGTSICLQIGPDGNVYVGGWTNDRIRVFNGETGAVIGVVLSGTIDRVARFCFGPDIDNDGIEDLYTAEGGAGATGLVRSWTSSSGYLSLGSYSASGLCVQGAWGCAFGPDVTGDGKQELFLRDGENNNYTGIKVANGATGQLVYAAATPEVASGKEIRYGSDGRIYISSNGNDRIVSYLPTSTGLTSPLIASYPVEMYSPVSFAEGEPGMWYVSNSGTGGTVIRFSFAAFDKILIPTALGKGWSGLDVFYTTQRGAAHDPVPTGTAVNSEVVSSVSWYSPEQDANGASADDPNIAAVTGYDVYWSTADANFIGEAAASVNQPGQGFTPTPAITYNTTYYWRVDARVTWDSNSITGNFTDVIKGADWKFTTKPQYLPPVMTFGNVITAMDLPPAVLSATVTNNSLPITSAVFTLLTDDAEFPAGAVATLTTTTVDNQNPTATLTTNMAGNYKVKLVISDGSANPGATKEALAVVKVYADDCQAKKDAGGWVANYYDRNSDCYVNLTDFATFALAWFNDTTLAAQAPYTGIVGYVPLAVYNIRTEAEWVDPNDPNACSDGPISDTTGIRIQNTATASGGKNTGSATAGAWIEYTIDVPASAVGVPTDLYMGYGLNTGTQTLSFGTAENAAAYGIGTVSSTGSWYVFPGVKVGTVTFTTAGPQKVRTTYGGGLNVDWFSFAF